MMRGLSRTSRDVPPFCVMDGTHTLFGINIVGLRRAGFKADQIRALRDAFKALFGKRQNLRLAMERFLAEKTPTAEVREMIDFIRASKRGVAFGPHGDSRDDPAD